MSDGTNGTGACNTIYKAPSNKKTRMYMLTINNPTEDDVATIDELMDDDKVVDLIGQHERGEEGTLHIQLLINWKNPRAFNGVKKLFPRAHIEVAQHLIKSARYCSKDDTREELEPSWEKIGSKSLLKVWNMEQEQEILKIPYVTKSCSDPMHGLELYQWQKDILELYGTEPEHRLIHWYYDPIGDCGKTSFSKSLSMQYDDILLCTGSARDSKYLVAQWIIAHKWTRDPKMIIFDIARCQDSEKVSYQAIEDMKNGFYVSTKYESGRVIHEYPHVIIFANQLPDVSKMSLDRWRIHELFRDGTNKDITKEHIELSIEE